MFVTSNEAYDAMEVTSDLLRNALRDGVQAIEAELPELEEVDEVTDSFEDMYDGLVLARMVIVPEPVSEEPVDLTTES